MNSKKNQGKAVFVLGLFQVVIGMICYIIGLKHHPILSTHYIIQTGNILFISSFVTFLSAFHAYLARLALNEKHERDVLRSGETNQLFKDEFEQVGRHENSLNQFEKIITPVLLVVISCTEIALASWVIWMELSHSHQPLTEDRSLILPFTSMMAAAAVVFFILSKYYTAIAYGSKKYYLRPVSGYTFYGACVCALNIMVSLLFYWGYPIGLSTTTWILCGISLLVATERVMIWIIDLYRPQSKRIPDLPIYESRFLGLFSQPQGTLRAISDLIDYQFGITISERLISRCFTRIIFPFALLQFITLSFLSCIIYIQPHEQGILEKWGSDSLTTLDAGIHVKFPWPICRVYRVETQRVQQLQIPAKTEINSKEGSQSGRISLWSDKHFSKNLHLTASFRKNDGLVKKKTTGSIPVNLAFVKISVYYRVKDSLTYFTSNTQPIKLLENLSLRELARYMVEHDFSLLLKSGIDMMSRNLTDQIQTTVDAHNLGLHILQVSIHNLQPPPEVAPSYRAVMETQEKRTRQRIEAEQYAVKLQAESEQEANRLVREAESDTALITSLAEVEKANYSKQHKIYKKYPQLYKTRSTMDALEEWLEDVRKVVVTTGDAREVINIELKKMQPDLLSVPLE